jgi:hypothetical protein
MNEKRKRDTKRQLRYTRTTQDSRDYNARYDPRGEHTCISAGNRQQCMYANIREKINLVNVHVVTLLIALPLSAH